MSIQGISLRVFVFRQSLGNILQFTPFFTYGFCGNKRQLACYIIRGTFRLEVMQKIKSRKLTKTFGKNTVYILLFAVDGNNKFMILFLKKLITNSFLKLK